MKDDLPPLPTPAESFQQSRPTPSRRSGSAGNSPSVANQRNGFANPPQPPQLPQPSRSNVSSPVGMPSASQLGGKDLNVPPDMQSVFRDVDKNRTGQLSPRELGHALVNGDYRPFHPDTVKLMIRMFDSDSTGTINFAEFCNLWRYLGEWRKLFAQFDISRKEAITYDEFCRALNAFGYRLSNQFISFMFSNYALYNNSRGEKIMSFDLFVQACISLKRMTDSFKQYDTDRDGFITLGFEQFMLEVLKQR